MKYVKIKSYYQRSVSFELELEDDKLKEPEKLGKVNLDVLIQPKYEIDDLVVI